MSKLGKVFQGSNNYVFLPVIHVEDMNQACINAEIAFDWGADGIFLIGHGMEFSTLNRVYDGVREIFPDRWIGINYLDRRSHSLSILPSSANALWTDNGGIDDRGVSLSAGTFLEERMGSSWRGLYFGGVAFKHQLTVNDVGLAAKNAVRYVDVITTSGPKTGEPPPVSKIKEMRISSGGHPLAIASGLTPANILEYTPYADCFLVSTGISSSFTELEPSKVYAFAKRLGK